LRLSGQKRSPFPPARITGIMRILHYLSRIPPYPIKVFFASVAIGTVLQAFFKDIEFRANADSAGSLA
jgi:hypothetical protein